MTQADSGSAVTDILDIPCGAGVFLCADHHLGHEGVTDFEDRPFPSLDAMRDGLIERHNAAVTRDDATVLFLGDLYWGWVAEDPKHLRIVREFLAALRGRKILLRGNHDHFPAPFYLEAGFDAVATKEILLRCGERRDRIVRCVHSPEPVVGHLVSGFEDMPEGYGRVATVLEQGAALSGEWFCGHVHRTFRKLGPIVNVGLDLWDFAPVPLDAALAMLEDPTTVIPGPRGFVRKRNFSLFYDDV